jgi:DNA-nicking Smr family endonuclease
MTRKPPTLPENDAALWEAAMKGVRKVTKDPKYTEKPKATTPKTPQTKPTPHVKPRQQERVDITALQNLAPSLKANTAPHTPQETDSTNWYAQIDAGKLNPQRKLDLHGMTLTAAHETLLRFLRDAKASKLRCVLVITGKGRGGEGAIRRELPLWLSTASLSPLILTTAQALPKHGGSGAVYVILKK